MPDVKSVRIIEKSEDGSRTVSEWVGIVKEFKTTIKWVEEDIWNDADHTCTFSLVKGRLRQVFRRVEVYGRWRGHPLGQRD